MDQHRSEIENFLARCERTELLVAISSSWLNEILIGIERLVGCDQGTEYHAEGDAAVHTSLVFETLVAVCREDLGREADFIERLAALIHDWKKPLTRSVGPNGSVGFPGHEQAAAAEVATLVELLELTAQENEKLYYLVSEHGNAHNFSQLPADKQLQIRCSPFVESLCALQKADAMSCHLGAGGHLPVRWNEIFPRESKQS